MIAFGLNEKSIAKFKSEKRLKLCPNEFQNKSGAF